MTGYQKDCQQFLGLAKGSCRSHAKNEKITTTTTTEPKKKTAWHFWHWTLRLRNTRNKKKSKEERHEIKINLNKNACSGGDVACRRRSCCSRRFVCQRRNDDINKAHDFSIATPHIQTTSNHRNTKKKNKAKRGKWANLVYVLLLDLIETL